MDIRITPGKLSGPVTPPISKSMAHRMVLAQALSPQPGKITNLTPSQDIEATEGCIRALAAPRTAGELPRLDCGESGSTLRFLNPIALPVAGGGVFTGRGRLMQRPQQPYFDIIAQKGIAYSRMENLLAVRGTLTPGDYALPGNVSSQFVTGLLFALPLLRGDSEIRLTSPLESKGYVDMTLSALQTFGLTPPQADGSWKVSPGVFQSPGTLRVEGDWSNAAPWLCMGVLGGDGITVDGMDPNSLQGDKAVCEVLARMGGTISGTTAQPGTLSPVTIDARNIPDLVPVLAAAAAAIPGETRVVGAARLRLKESDRLATTAQTLNALGGEVEETEDGLIIRGKSRLVGGTVDAQGDHRIAMLAAVASVVCDSPVTITGAEAIRKSYPAFWEDLRALGKEVAEE